MNRFFFALRRLTETPKNFLHCIRKLDEGAEIWLPWRNDQVLLPAKMANQDEPWTVGLGNSSAKDQPDFFAKNPNNYKDGSIAKFSLEASNINLPNCWRLQAY